MESDTPKAQTDTSAYCILWSVVAQQRSPTDHYSSLFERDISNIWTCFLFFFKERNYKHVWDTRGSNGEKKKEKHQQETDQTVCVMQISHRVIIFKIPKAIINLLTKMVRLPLHRRRRRSHPARSPELLCFGVKTHYTALQLPGKLWDAGIPLTVMSSRWIHFTGH